MRTSPSTTIHLQDLHDRYAAAIDLAVADNNLALVDELAASYDAEALELLAS